MIDEIRISTFNMESLIRCQDIEYKPIVVLHDTYKVYVYDNK